MLDLKKLLLGDRPQLGKQLQTTVGSIGHARGKSVFDTVVGGHRIITLACHPKRALVGAVQIPRAGIKHLRQLVEWHILIPDQGAVIARQIVLPVVTGDPLGGQRIVHKQGVAIAVGVDKIKTRKGLHAQCIAPLFEVVGLAHRQPLLDLPYFAHARITHRVSAVIGAQYRAMHRAQPLFSHRPGNKPGELDVYGDIA